MAPIVPISPDAVRDLELLVRAGHTFIIVDPPEHERVAAILDHLAEQLSTYVYEWSAHAGIVPHDDDVGSVRPPARESVVEMDDGETDVPSGLALASRAVADTITPAKCLEWIEGHGRDTVVFLPGMLHFLDDKKLVARLRTLHDDLAGSRTALVFSSDDDAPPPELARLFTRFTLEPLSQGDYHKYVSAIVRDIRRSMKVDVALTPEDVSVILEQLRGLTLFEVRKIVTKAIIEDGRFDAADIAEIGKAKRAIIERSGVLEYYPAEHSLGDVAGLVHLKAWLGKRKRAFTDPGRARKMGIPPPRGLLLIGVQGCGKSLCAKAVAKEWSLPLVRLDPSNLYNKFFGESEKNLGRAIHTAEAMAPIVLWIDEIEKAFASASADSSSDSGVSQRIFGAFLTWLNDKKESVFVVATANDVSRLPPELIRKGRFDEIFFVDLPEEPVREELFALHLKRRGRDPAAFDLPELAAKSAGFSGAEIEQVVVAGLYTAFAEDRDVDTATLITELSATRPLTVTMSDRVAALREWARERAVPAG